MQIFELLVAVAQTRTGKEACEKDGCLMYHMPDDASTLLEPIMAPYGQNPYWYFDKIGHGKPPAPWALVCFESEYAMAGHIASCRPAGSEISFVPYSQTPDPIPNQFVPKVGTLFIGSKDGIRDAAALSPIFSSIWDSLNVCSAAQRWLLVHDALPNDILAVVTSDNDEQWLLSRTG